MIRRPLYSSIDFPDPTQSTEARCVPRPPSPVRALRRRPSACGLEGARFPTSAPCCPGSSSAGWSLAVGILLGAGLVWTERPQESFLVTVAVLIALTFTAYGAWTVFCA